MQWGFIVFEIKELKKYDNHEREEKCDAKDHKFDYNNFLSKYQ